MGRKCGDFTMWGTPEEELEVDPSVFCGKDIDEGSSRSPPNPEINQLPTSKHYRYIDAEDLLYLKERLEERREICGIVFQGEGELQLQSRDIGPYISNGERGSCKSTNVWINFHTHPYITLPWPSVEDIFKVLESRSGPILWGSLIFCEWGIWEIYSPEKVSRRYLDSVQKEWTENASDKLFYDLGLKEDFEVPDLKEVHGPLQTFLNKWYVGWKDTGLEITLTDWRDVPGHYPLQTGLQQVPS